MDHNCSALPYALVRGSEFLSFCKGSESKDFRFCGP